MLILKRLVPFIIVSAATLCSVEGASYIGVKLLSKRLVFYNPPLISTYDDYMQSRDPVLGWPSKKMLREKYDASGSRPIPSFPNPGNACISLYGDSFTWSDSASDAEAWSNQLSLDRKCRVSNYGVPGYGTDQALMRFEQNDHDEAHIVMLNHFTGDIRRNVSQFRNLTSDDDYFLFKPRFVLKNGELDTIALVSPTREEAERIASHPELELNHEHFAPGGPSGIVKAHFPYIGSLVEALGNEHLQSKLKGIPVWEPYYHADHPSDALRITVAIMERFNSIAKQRGKRPILTIIPNAHDIHFFTKKKAWSYAPLLSALEERKLEVIDFGPAILERLEERDVCEVMEASSCYGHFNAAGYKILADIVDDYLTYYP